jgi:hypothetical protein
MKGKKLNDITPAEWDEASRKALANLAKQKKLSTKMTRPKTHLQAIQSQAKK